MKKRITGALLVLGVTTGCASIEKPPERQYWDEVPASTNCTDDKSAVVAQGVGSIVAGGLGGADIGAGLAAGYFPVVGIGLTAIGLTAAVDADKKTKEIEKCQDFKEYVSQRNSVSPLNEEGERSVSERLDTLEELRESDSISEQEYKRKREEIIDDF